MPRSENHVRDRLKNVEAELASLRGLATDIHRLRGLADNIRWLLRTIVWVACTIVAELVSGPLGRIFGALAKLFG